MPTYYAERFEVPLTFNGRELTLRARLIFKDDGEVIVRALKLYDDVRQVALRRTNLGSFVDDVETGERVPADGEPPKPVVDTCIFCDQVIARPDLRGTWWCRDKKGRGVCMSFSAAVVQEAGGIDRLLTEWTQVDVIGRPVAWPTKETL